MRDDSRHRAFLQFISRIADIASRYSKEDLGQFASRARDEYPAMTGLVEQYLRVAERADTDVVYQSPRSKRSRRSSESATSGPAHLFDLLRAKRLFPTNADLARFAARIVPGMVRRRFDKMSRGDIAARIIEYLETLDEKKRRRLEKSMRDAVASTTESPGSDKDSFFLQWEKIIKGIDF